MVADAQHNQTVLGFFVLIHRAFSHNHVGAANVVLGDQLILDQNQGFHGVLQRKLVLAHLRKNRADVQVDIARV